LSYGPEPGAEVLFQTGEAKRIAVAELHEYVTERGNPGNRKGVREALVTYPSAWLKDGIRLVDTPGVGSVYQQNTETTHRFLPKADAVLFLLSVDQPISQAESDFLASVRQYSDKILFVLNKVDLLSEAELAESLEFTRGTLSEIIGAAPRLFPLSARFALSAHQQGSEELLAKSGMPQLNQALAQFLEKEKSSVLTASVARQAKRAVNLARFELQVELQSLAAPLEDLDRKSALFQEKKREIALAKDEIALLLGNDASRALQQPIEEDLAQFSQELTRRVVAKIEQRNSELHDISLRQLHSSLEGEVVDEARQAFDAWQAGESAALDKSFDTFCARHAAKIDAALEELFRFCSDLFAIPFVPLGAGSFRKVESRFYYKFWTEPPGISTLITNILLALPRAFGTRVVLNAIRRYALETVDIQSGRMRYDFSQRLDKALRTFKQELGGKIDTAIAGIELAMAKARELRSAGERATRERQEALQSALRSLDEIDRQIGPS